MSSRVKLPEAALFSPSDVASSVFLPLFIVELARANTPRRHPTRTRSRTDAAGGEKGDGTKQRFGEKKTFNFIIYNVNIISFTAITICTVQILT